jgi:hypothetical protein
MGPIGCPETQVRKYQPTLRKITKQRRAHTRKALSYHFLRHDKYCSPALLSTNLSKLCAKYHHVLVNLRDFKSLHLHQQLKSLIYCRVEGLFPHTHTQTHTHTHSRHIHNTKTYQQQQRGVQHERR